MIVNGFYYQIHSLKLENSDCQFTQTQEMHQRGKITAKTEYEQTVFDEM